MFLTQSCQGNMLSIVWIFVHLTGEKWYLSVMLRVKLDILSSL